MGGPSVEARKRWFGGLDAQNQADFDASCRRVSAVALRSLGPNDIRLAPFIDFETDRRNAASIVRPIKEAFTAGTRPGAMTIQTPETVEKPSLDRPGVALALVLLLDQMPRNVFRKPEEQQRVYLHYDRLARAFVRSVVLDRTPSKTTDLSHTSAIDQDDRIKLNPAHRLWFYMPLQHSEDIKDHELLDDLIADMEEPLKESGDPASLEHFQAFMAFQKRHRVIIERFGRYPHRNESLGRETTPEELKWLNEGGDRFGR